MQNPFYILILVAFSGNVIFFYGRVPSFLVPFPNKQFAIISESSVNYFRISIHSPHPSQVYLNDQSQGTL